MSLLLMQAMNNTVMASISMDLVDDLIAGVLPGIVIGIFVGALLLPMITATDTILRSIAFGIFGAVGMSLFQLARIGRATGERLGTILAAFTGPYTNNLGGMIRDGIVWVFYAMFAGALIGMVTQVPDKVIKGGIVGLFLGGFVGAGLHALLVEFNIAFAPPWG